MRFDNPVDELIQNLRPLGQSGSRHIKNIVEIVVNHSLFAWEEFDHADAII
jgi:hypothetical protein